MNVEGTSASLRWLLVAAATFAMALAAFPAWAAEAEGHGNPWMDFLWKTVNFAILAGILIWLLRKPVGKALREAAQRAAQMLADVRASGDQMERRYQDQKRNLENLKSELERMREEAAAETAAESKRLRDEAQAAADRLTSQLDQQVEAARRHALHSIRHELAAEAVKQAEAMIRQRLDEKSQLKLLDERIGQQERVP